MPQFDAAINRGIDVVRYYMAKTVKLASVDYLKLSLLNIFGW